MDMFPGLVLLGNERLRNALSSPPCKTRMQHLMQGIPYIWAFQVIKTLTKR